MLALRSIIWAAARNRAAGSHNRGGRPDRYTDDATRGIVLLFLAHLHRVRLSGPAPGLGEIGPGPAQLIGQKLMVAMSGTALDSDLLGRVGRGEVGGVILFGFQHHDSERLGRPDRGAAKGR